MIPFCQVCYCVHRLQTSCLQSSQCRSAWLLANLFLPHGSFLHRTRSAHYAWAGRCSSVLMSSLARRLCPWEPPNNGRGLLAGCLSHLQTSLSYEIDCCQLGLVSVVHDNERHTETTVRSHNVGIKLCDDYEQLRAAVRSAEGRCPGFGSSSIPLEADIWAFLVIFQQGCCWTSSCGHTSLETLTAAPVVCSSTQVALLRHHVHKN